MHAVPVATHNRWPVWTLQEAHQLDRLERLCHRAETSSKDDLSFYKLVRKMQSLGIVPRLPALSHDLRVQTLMDLFSHYRRFARKGLRGDVIAFDALRLKARVSKDSQELREISMKMKQLNLLGKLGQFKGTEESVARCNRMTLRVEKRAAQQLNLEVEKAWRDHLHLYALVARMLNFDFGDPKLLSQLQRKAQEKIQRDIDTFYGLSAQLPGSSDEDLLRITLDQLERLNLVDKLSYFEGIEGIQQEYQLALKQVSAKIPVPGLPDDILSLICRRLSLFLD